MAYSPMQLAEAFIHAGELPDALDVLNPHIEANPGDDAARRLRAQVLTRLPDEEHLQVALDDLAALVNPTAEDALRRAILLEQIGDFDAARMLLAQIHADNPGDEPIAERYFWLLMRARGYDEAGALLQRMPRTWDWLSRAGDLATEDGHVADAPGYYSEALRLLESAFDLSVDSFARPIQTNLLMARGQAYATLQQFPEAEADYAAAGVLMPDDLMIAFWRSFVLLELGQTEQAVTLCRSALEGANPTLREMMVGTIEAVRPNPTFEPLAELI